MPRPRRATAEAFYDVFADFSIEDQAAALKILEQVHRLRIRETSKRPAPAPGSFVLKGGPMSQEESDAVKPLFEAAKEQG